MQKPMISKEQAWLRLSAGNTRFVEEKPEAHTTSPEERAASRLVQHPIAAILTCSDARVAPEIIFDQGFGQLFVIRVAGQVVDDSVISSIEWVINQFGTPLIMVLGHHYCAAVRAAVTTNPHTNMGSPHLTQFCQRLRNILHVEESQVVSADDPNDHFIRKNVLESMRLLRAQSSIIDSAIRTGELDLMGAVYELDSGKVKQI